jgi:SAM-dependent methyltransferase
MSGQADPVGTPDDAIAAIQVLIAGARNTQLIYVMAKLGLADVLHGGPRNADDIAAELGVNAPVLRRLLRGLVNRGLVAEERAGTFSLTALGQYLRADAPGALRNHAIRSGEIQYPAWGSLLYAVETGQSAFENAHGTDIFGYLSANPAANDSFNESMMARTESIVDGIVAAHDFSPFARIVDVGGGVGVLLSRILEMHSASTGILYDTAAVTQKASAYLARRGLSGRVEVIAGDFFAAVPRGDLLVLQAVLHDWDNERAALILRQCRKALEPTGRMLIIEDILPGKVDGGMPLIEDDLTMLVCHNGQERTLAEYEELLVREGFCLESVGDTGSCKLIAASAAPEIMPERTADSAGEPRPRGSSSPEPCAPPAAP